MNKLFLSLLGTSIVALVLAIVCGAWLFLQSWEDGRRLERQNRELQASLEASRVRLENFCEYPVEALCNLDEPAGTVSSVMGGIEDLAPSLPEPATSLNRQPENDVPSAQQTAEEQRPVEPAAAQTATADEERSDSDSLPSAGDPSSDTAKKQPQKKNGNMDSASSTDSVPDTRKANDSGIEQGRNPSGERSAMTVFPKKTWSTLNLHNESMTLRIAGEGKSLIARGKLLQDPPRYVVTMQGAWKVSNRHPSTTLVKNLQIFPSEGNTLLVFELSGQPEHCSVEQEDARTIAVSIR